MGLSHVTDVWAMTFFLGMDTVGLMAKPAIKQLREYIFSSQQELESTLDSDGSGGLDFLCERKAIPV